MACCVCRNLVYFDSVTNFHHVIIDCLYCLLNFFIFILWTHAIFKNLENILILCAWFVAVAVYYSADLPGKYAHIDPLYTF